MQRRLAYGVAEHWELGDGLGLRVDGLAATLGVFAPVRDEAPLDQIEGALAGFVVLPNDQKLLARRRIVAGADVAHPAIADIEAVNDGEAAKGSKL